MNHYIEKHKKSKGIIIIEFSCKEYLLKIYIIAIFAKLISANKI